MTVSVNLPYADLETLWIMGGGARNQSSMAAAIATAESGGNPTAMNGQYVSGLWQINTAPNANPEYTVSDMQNPLKNAQAAVALSKNGTDWTPWQTYTNGAYKTYYKSGVSPAPTSAQLKQYATFGSGNGNYLVNKQGQILGGGTQPLGIPNPLPTISTVAGLISFITDPAKLLRLGEIILGGLILLMALDQIVKSAGGPDIAGTIKESVPK
jgi:hypothetical protein